MFHNGESVTWGSNDELRPTATIRHVEELGSVAVAGYHNECVVPLMGLLRDAEVVLRGQLLTARADDKDVLMDTIVHLRSAFTGRPPFIVRLELEAEFESQANSEADSGCGRGCGCNCKPTQQQG
jgi:hypothetical protein